MKKRTIIEQPRATPISTPSPLVPQPLVWLLWYQYWIVLLKEEVINRFHSPPPPPFCSLRFAVSVRRQNYPLSLDTDSPYSLDQPQQRHPPPHSTAGPRSNPSPSSWIQPAHLVTFLSPVVVVNLLPCHLTFRKREIESTPQQERRKTSREVGQRGERQQGQGAAAAAAATAAAPSTIKPGKEAWLPVNTSRQMALTLSLDQFPNAADVILPANCSSTFEARVRLTDAQDRPLFLQVRVAPVVSGAGAGGVGGAVRVTVYAPIWLVNKTGLPLVFRQEGYTIEAAGQDVEHEVKNCMGKRRDVPPKVDLFH